MLQIVIPAYNEEARLPRTLRDLRRYVRAHKGTFTPVEVIVVDNASTDRTAEVALEADSPAMRVRVIGCGTRGKGAAVQVGIAATTAPVVAFMDADGATHLDALEEAWRQLAKGAHVAIGSRSLEGSDTAARHSRLRETGGRWYRSLSARVVPGVADTQCGFKVMNGVLARRVFADLRTRGFSFDVELLARLQATGARIVEFPVQWADVPGSTFAPLRHGAGSFLALARIGWTMRGQRAVPAFVAPATLTVDPAAHPLVVVAGGRA